MDGHSLLQIRDALLQRRHKLRECERAEAVNQTVEASKQVVELIDIAQTLEQIDRDSSLAEQERRDLEAIERALAKLATGAFGICEDCGDEIAARRLVVLPEARLCARCQTVEERLQNRGRGAGGVTNR